MFYSIIIPVQNINDYIMETCSRLEALDNKNFEVLIFPDTLEDNNEEMERTLGAKIVDSGKVSPATKRDMAMKYARGDILAFIDDDAYPENNWLNVAEHYLKNDNMIAAIGGPQLTPPHDSFWQKVSGAVFLSPLSGRALIRYWPGKKIQEVDDWPSVNFLIRRDDFTKIGGFDSHHWPGEDTKLCLDITRKLGKKILYIPDLIVYHHRRTGLRKHLRQIGNYGLHRGYFAKKLPETSKKIIYFIPPVFVVFIVSGIIASFLYKPLAELFLFGLMIYVLTVLLTTISVWGKVKNLLISVATIPYLILTHIWYGVKFIQGFVFTTTLKSKLGK
jgi:GT2 family glycosyltransferase